MNRDQFSGKWHEFKGKIKEQWGKLTDDDVHQINGKWEQLSGKLQQKYGWQKDHAEREMNNWCKSCEHRGEGRGEENRFNGEQYPRANNEKTHSNPPHKGTREENRPAQEHNRNSRKEEERSGNQQQWHQKGESDKKYPGKDQHPDKKRKAS
jgi:uncharacterized protein YjbJ (UPF0337 family)